MPRTTFSTGTLSTAFVSTADMALLGEGRGAAQLRRVRKSVACEAAPAANEAVFEEAAQNIAIE